MMPANPEILKRELVQRTKTNLVNYQGEYEVTELINATLCLLILPKETIFDQIKDEMIDSTLLNDVKKHCKDSSMKLKDIVRHMRNALAHGHIEFGGAEPNRKGDDRKITNIIFRDFEDYRAPTPKKLKFEMNIPLERLKMFVLGFSAAAQKLM